MRIEPIRLRDMLRYRVKHQAAIIAEHKRRIADSERGIGAAKTKMREINQQISEIDKRNL